MALPFRETRSCSIHPNIFEAHENMGILSGETYIIKIETNINFRTIKGNFWFTKLLLTRFKNGEGNGNPLQYSCLENPMGGGDWWAAVHGVAKSQTRLYFHFHLLEKEMATHSSVLAWRIPGTREPLGLPSMGSRRVRHDWSDLAAAV